MSTISVPLNSKLESSLDYLVKSGVAESRAAVMRKALTRLSEEEAIEAVFRAEREIAEGKGVSGDLRTLMKKFK
jgi:Arc/MetJ-type ribon-helix-helix transcriptional regulator